MKVTSDVITDLLPLYVSGEASADTRKLVDEYLLADPALARELAELSEPRALAARPPRLDPDLELRTFVRTRKLLKLRGALMGAGIFFSLLPFSFSAGNGHVTWAWSRAPYLATVIAAVAAGTWAAYASVRRRLRTTGL